MPTFEPGAGFQQNCLSHLDVCSMFARSCKHLIIIAQRHDVLRANGVRTGGRAYGVRSSSCSNGLSQQPSIRSISSLVLGRIIE